MQPKIIYLNRGGRELNNPTRREIEFLSRREAIKRAALFLPLSFFLGSRITSKATSVIISRTISAANQNAAQMSNSTFARPVTIPASWSKIRVGARLHMTNTGANLTGGPIFSMGFNSGTAAQYGDATCQNFVGLTILGSSTGVYTWVNSGTTQYEMLSPGNGGGQFAQTRVGTTNTNSTLYADGANCLVNSGAGTNSADRQIMFLDITKGSPNYTFHLPFRCVTGPGAGADVTAANFLMYMGQSAPTPVESGYDRTNLASPTLAVNEGTNGTLNAVNFYWNRVDAVMELTDIAVAVLA